MNVRSAIAKGAILVALALAATVLSYTPASDSALESLGLEEHQVEGADASVVCAVIGSGTAKWIYGRTSRWLPAFLVGYSLTTACNIPRGYTAVCAEWVKKDNKGIYGSVRYLPSRTFYWYGTSRKNCPRGTWQKAKCTGYCPGSSVQTPWYYQRW